MWELGRLARSSPMISAAFDAGVDGVLDALAASNTDDAAEFLARFDQFLFDHGARGQNEYDPISVSWEVRPRIALAAIDLMRRSDDQQAPSVRHATSVVERDRLAADIRQRLAGDAETLGLFDAALHSSQLFLSGRERAKTNIVTVINEVRVAMRELGRRLVEKGVIDEIEQVFMLTDDELDQVRHEPDAFRPVILARWSEYRALFEHEPVFIVNGRAPDLSEMTRRDAKLVAVAGSGTVLRGAAGSGGVASGRARVVLDAADPEGLVRAGGGGRRQRRRHGQPRHDRVARAGHPVRGVDRRRHRGDPRRGDRHRRRHRRNRDHPLGLAVPGS
jgi:pyruvate,water dikinase